MPNIKTRSNRLTYGQLNKVLTMLGFERRKTPEFTAYREASHGAWIILPVMRSDKLVGDPHLVTVRNTVIGNGITSGEKFQSLLTNVIVKTDVMPSQTTPRLGAKRAKPRLREKPLSTVAKTVNSSQV